MNYEETFNAILENLSGIKYVNHINAEYKEGFCPHLQFITIDALDPNDWPHGIAQNSISLGFDVNLKENKIELYSYGHVYLSPADLATERYKYLAMKSMVNVAVDMGGKKFRKCKFKTPADAAKKMTDYWVSVMECVEKYTGGYPYKNGK